MAGDTTSDVPTMNITSHVFAWIIASSHTLCGKPSPNQTTSGLKIFPHLHNGGILENSDKFSFLKSHPEHFIFIILPCNSRTFVLPAFWWSPSIFWVRTITLVKFSNSAIALCPRFGFAWKMLFLLSLYHSQTSFGFS